MFGKCLEYVWEIYLFFGKFIFGKFIYFNQLKTRKNLKFLNTYDFFYRWKMSAVTSSIWFTTPWCTTRNSSQFSKNSIRTTSSNDAYISWDLLDNFWEFLKQLSEAVKVDLQLQIVNFKQYILQYVDWYFLQIYFMGRNHSVFVGIHEFK